MRSRGRGTGSRHFCSGASEFDSRETVGEGTSALGRDRAREGDPPLAVAAEPANKWHSMECMGVLPPQACDPVEVPWGTSLGPVRTGRGGPIGCHQSPWSMAGPMASLLSSIRGMATACYHTRASANAEGVSAALSGGTGRHGRPQGVLNRLRTLGCRVTTVQDHCKGHRPPLPAPLVGGTGHYGPEVCWVLPGLLNRLRTLGRRVTTVWRSIGSAIDRWDRLRTLGRRVTKGSLPAGTWGLPSWLIGLGVIQACARS